MRWQGLAVVLAACSYQPSAGSIDGDGAPAPDDGDVQGDSPRDAAPDSSAFICPETYDVTLPATTSRYRVISSNATFWSHRTTCNETEATHVAVIDSALEAVQLEDLAATSPQPTNGRFYLGAIQDATSTTTGGGWIWVTGGTVQVSAWGVFNGLTQPDDGTDGAEGNHEEQLVALDPSVEFLIDVRGMTGYGAICECDGKTETATATALIDADPSNPN